MSGGIDSSVAAYLLKKEGYDVSGITMLIWKPDSPYPVPMSANSCYSPDKTKDLEKIREISERIGIKHFTVDCSDLFESDVLGNFRSEYMNGHTPNPCIWCNQKIKFGAMLGDEVEVGCGSVLNPGTVVGSHSNIYPLSSVRGFVPGNSIYKKQGEVVEKRDE